MTQWEDALRNLATPEPPADTINTVMAQVRVIESARRSSESKRKSTAPEKHEQTSWRVVAIAAGITAIVGAYLLRSNETPLANTIFLPRLFSWADGAGAADGSSTLLAATGIVLYLGVAILLFRVDHFLQRST